ncbi:carboxypeptidase-like regulatory domain-containing protein [Algibacter sp. 2305UL17-15]|uniref:carboxypeptidase-like regulatory domain-containing protein n=1 Tax=Algibacter sp. 2305UL17-15 TaxID=3231268 RepID=UPI00345923E0
MEQKFNLTISKPCSEKFSQFKETSTGGFCSSCQKNVIDFRKMSDEQLIKHFKNNDQNTCGYFNFSQLKDYSFFNEPQKTSNFKYLRIFSLTFFSMLSLHTIQAQDNTPKTEIVQELNTNKSDTNKKVVAQDGLLTGIISDESGPLPGANILLKGTSTGTSANFDGEFTFPKALKKGDVLLVSYLGFETRKIVIKENQTILNVIMPSSSCVLMGEVEVSTIYKSKRSFWQKLKGIF